MTRCGQHSHEAILDKVRHDLPTDELLFDLSDLFRIFGDTTRIKILFSLFESEMCVCAIAELLGMTQSAISHQLKTLKNANLSATDAREKRFTTTCQTTMCERSSHRALNT